MDPNVLFVLAVFLVKMLPWAIAGYLVMMFIGICGKAFGQRQAANLEHLTNFHYYDYPDRYYNYAQRQWILK